MRSTVILGCLICLLPLWNNVYSIAADDAGKPKDTNTKTAPVSAETNGQDTPDGSAPNAGAAPETTPENSAEAKPEKKPEKRNVAMLSIRGSFPETAPQLGLFGALEVNLTDMMRRLRRVSEDEEISAVVLRLQNPQIGRAKLAEMRAAISRVRKAGKKVYAELDTATPADYLIACACDEIIMPESGTVFIPGVRAEVTFYKGLLDKLGIKADMMQVGDCKGAAEPFTRSSMSPEYRKQFEGLIDDMYQMMVETIAADRKLDEHTVKELIDIGLFSPADAKKAGLIDTVAYESGFQERLKKDLSADQLVIKKNYGRKKVDTDFSGMLGMMKMLELMMGGSQSKRSSKAKKIAVVYAVGTIMMGESGSSLFGGQVIGSDTLVQALKKAGEDKTVVAIILRVDSPGGSALASDLIWHEIEQICGKKPVLASMGDVAASGGYYICMGCDKIYAETGTLTGSIGVVGGKLAIGGLYEKAGLSTDVISRGKNSGIFSTESPFSESEREIWKKMMEEIYRQFTTKAAKGRNMGVEKLKPLAGGRVWTGRQAKANGLVDEVGTFHDAVAAAKKMAGLKEDEKAEMLILPKPRSFFDQLFNAPTAESRVRIRGTVNALAPGAARHLGEIDTLRRLFTEPAVLIMPCRVEIR